MSRTKCGARLRHLSRCLVLVGGSMLFQATAGGCGDGLAAFADALGQPIATGLGNGVSRLVEGLVLGLFI